MFHSRGAVARGGGGVGRVVVGSLEGGERAPEGEMGGKGREGGKPREFRK